MIELLNSCFKNAKLKVFNEIDWIETIQQMNSFDNDLFRTVFIYEFLNKMSSFTGHDFLPDYLEYMKKLNEKWQDKFNQLMEDL